MIWLVLLGVLLSALGVALAVSGLVLAVRRSRLSGSPSVPRLNPAFVFVAGVLLTFVVGPVWFAIGCAPTVFPEWWLPSVARHGDEIVAAIQRFQANTGSPPAMLRDLVPSYLTRIPDTGYAGNSHWEYTIDGASWHLAQPINGMPLDFDEFRYDPSGPSGARIGYRHVARHGDWVYLDD